MKSAGLSNGSFGSTVPASRERAIEHYVGLSRWSGAGAHESGLVGGHQELGAVVGVEL